MHRLTDIFILGGGFMYINKLLQEKQISKYKLAKESGVPQTTISDICSGRARIEKCSAETIYKIAKLLDVSMESLVEESILASGKEKREAFETYKSNICHYVKDKGDIEFIIDMLEKDEVRRLYRLKWYAEAFYLLGMVDYLSRENDVPICTNYDDLRTKKLSAPLYPTGAILLDQAMKTDEHCKKCEANAIPEFKRFNLMECEVRDAV